MRSAGLYDAQEGGYYWDQDPKAVQAKTLDAARLSLPDGTGMDRYWDIRTQSRTEIMHSDADIPGALSPDDVDAVGLYAGLHEKMRPPAEYSIDRGFNWSVVGAPVLQGERAQLEMPPKMTIDYGEQQWQQ